MKAGVVIPDGHRWGLHNLRHSQLSVTEFGMDTEKPCYSLLGYRQSLEASGFKPLIAVFPKIPRRPIPTQFGNE